MNKALLLQGLFVLIGFVIAGCTLEEPRAYGEKCDVAFIQLDSGNIRKGDIAEYDMYFDFKTCPENIPFCRSLDGEYFCSQYLETNCPNGSHVMDDDVRACESNDVQNCGKQGYDCISNTPGTYEGHVACNETGNGDVACVADDCLETFDLMDNACLTSDQCCGPFCNNCLKDERHSLCSVDGCVEKCPEEGEISCNGSCVNPMTSRSFCGASQDDCRVKICAANDHETCVQGECVCQNGYQECPDGCVAKNSVEHCGYCDNNCTLREGWLGGSCIAGVCRLSACKTGYHTAVNPKGDSICELDSIENCGSRHDNCLLVQSNPGVTEATCENGSCKVRACDEGYFLYENNCFKSTGQQCGSIDNVCGPHSHCNGATSKCECDTDYTDCNGGCYNLEESPSHCGSCDISCDVLNASNSCWASLCTFECDDGYVKTIDGTACEPIVCRDGETKCNGLEFQICENNHWSTTTVCTTKQMNADAACDDISGCGIICKDGYTDCDGVCYNLSANTEHCGSCSTTCNVDNASNHCSDSICSFDCDEGFHEYSNRCEADDTTNCGEHGNACKVSNALNSCENGECKFQCNDGYHLSETETGCSSDNVLNCGGVGIVCGTNQIPHGAGFECSNGICNVVDCEPGYHVYQNACEPDDLDNCGSHGVVCSRPNGTPSCSTGTCTAISCDGGFHLYNGACEKDDVANCGGHARECRISNGTPSCPIGVCTPSACDSGFHIYNNTCEAHSNTNCGAHDTPCSVLNGVGSCSTGTCTVTECRDGYHVFGNTCEAHSLANCGNHDETCSILNGVATCATGVCKLSRCNNGYHEYNGACEADDLQNCGTHANACNVANAENYCSSGNCGFVCIPGFHTFDGRCEENSVLHCGSHNIACEPGQFCGAGECGACQTGQHLNGNSCEPDSIDNCGSHGTVCSIDNGRPSCPMGTCTPDVCDNNYHIYSNMCEFDDIANCGEHGVKCQTSFASNYCDSGSCSFDCNVGYHRYDSICEVNDVTNCGNHGHHCLIDNGIPSCPDGTCKYTCNPGFCDNGTTCVDQKTDMDHCGGCNNACNTDKVAASLEVVCSSGTCIATKCRDDYHLKDGSCIPNECENGMTSCTNKLGIGQLSTCTNGVWSIPVSCSNASCNSSADGCGGCLNGSKQCQGSASQQICDNGEWKTIACTPPNDADPTCSDGVCDFQCKSGFTGNGVECIPNAEYCPSNSATRCVNDAENGSGTMQICRNNRWSILQPCDNGVSCNNTETACGSCLSGTKQCDDRTPQTCTNGAWVSANACNSDLYCNNGTCAACDANTHVWNNGCEEDSVANCGSHDNACEPPLHGNAVCSGASCTFRCDDDYTNTGTACVHNDAYCAVIDEERCVLNGTLGTMQKCIGNVWTDQNHCDGNASCNSTNTSCGICRNGAVQCDDRTPQTCVGGAWSNGDACNTTTQICSGGSCQVCSGDTHVSGNECEANSIENCGSHGNKCNKPANGSAVCNLGICGITCDTGFTSDGSSCISNSSFCSTPNATRCVNVGNTGKMQKCLQNEWSDTDPCDDGHSCNNGGTACGACVNDDVRCNERIPQICVTGSWSGSMPCDSSEICSSGSCSACGANAHVNDNSCEPDSVSHCGAHGLECHAPQNGTPKCTNGTCDFDCVSGYTGNGSRCIANDVYCTRINATRCENFGTTGKMQKCIDNEWTVQSSCSDSNSCNAGGTSCGGCINNALTCSGRNPMLCENGEWVDNGVCNTTNQICNGGACTTCDSNSHVWLNDCEPNSVMNCGAHEHECHIPSNGSATCNSGECGIVCNSGFTGNGTDCIPDNLYCSTNNATRCVNVGTAGKMQKCIGNQWTDQSYCSDDVSCNSGGTGCGSCVNGDSTCSGRTPKSCSGGAWIGNTACGAAEVCINGSCSTCNGDTHVWENTCEPDSVQHCGTHGNFCHAPQNGTPVCSGGTCDFDCNEGYTSDGSSCISNDSYCANNNATRCVNDGTTGTNQKCVDHHWTPQGACDNNYSCNSGGTACGSCVNNDVRCSGRAPQICSKGVWVGNGTCNTSSEICENGSCQNCGYNQHVYENTCENNTPLDCGSHDNECTVPENGEAVCINGACDIKCRDGYKPYKGECIALSLYCEEQNEFRCNNVDNIGVVDECKNYRWTFYKSCEPNSCSGKECGVCVDGKKQCSGRTPQTCTNGGWSNDSPCGALQICNNGSCQNCGSDQHVNGNLCENNSTSNCGTHGNKCTAPSEHGVATCIGGTCNILCDEGYFPDGTECIPDNNYCTNVGVNKCINEDNVGTVFECNSEHQWKWYKDCDPNSCHGDGCGSCKNDDIKCDYRTPKTCINGEWAGNSPCGSSQICNNGSCQNCGSDQHVNGNSCENNSIYHCGSHGNECHKPSEYGVAVCVGGVCDIKCEEGYLPEGNECVKDDNYCEAPGTFRCIDIGLIGRMDMCNDENQWKFYKDCETASCNPEELNCGDCKNGIRKCDERTPVLCSGGHYLAEPECEDTSICSNGYCVACGAGKHVHGNECETDDIENCGAHGNVCEPPSAHGEPACIAAVCGVICEDGFVPDMDGHECVPDETYCEEVGSSRCVTSGGESFEELCNDDQHWELSKRCEGISCNPENTACGECMNGSKQCSYRTPQTCNYGAWTGNSPCDPDKICNTSTGVCQSCGSNQHVNGNSCETNSISNCGSHGNFCTAPNNATPVCSGGNCTYSCNTGFYPVADACISSSSSCDDSEYVERILEDGSTVILYCIKNEDELETMADSISQNVPYPYPDGLPPEVSGYVLAKDMDFSTWNKPIGNDDNPFSLVFYGDDKTITVADESDSGLFGKVKGATIEHLQFVTKVKTDYPDIGGLANSAESSMIHFVIGNVDIQGANNVGGLIGNDQGVILTYSSVLGMVSAEGENVGGLIGQAIESNIANCTLSEITIHSNGNDAGSMVGHGEGISINESTVSEPCEVKCAAQCGAVAGWLSESSNIVNVTSDCRVKGTAGGVIGGFVGTINDSTILHSLSAGTVTNNMSISGGFIGMSNNSKISECVSFVSVSGEQGECGGFVGVNSSDEQEYFNCAAFGDVVCNGDLVGGFMGWGYGVFNNNLAVNRLTGMENVGGFAAMISQPSSSISEFYAIVRLISTNGIYYYFANTNGGASVSKVYYDEGDGDCRAVSCEIADVDYGEEINNVEWEDNVVKTPDYGNTIQCKLLGGEDITITVPSGIMDLVSIGCSE